MHRVCKETDRVMNTYMKVDKGALWEVDERNMVYYIKEPHVKQL